MVFQQPPDVFVDQLEDVLEHIKTRKEYIIAFVGHSNGVVNAILAAYLWGSSTDDNKSIQTK